MKKMLIALMLIAGSVMALDIGLPEKYLGYDILKVVSVSTYDGWKEKYPTCAEIVPDEAKKDLLGYTVKDKKVVKIDNSALKIAIATAVDYRTIVDGKLVAMTPVEVAAVDATKATAIAEALIAWKASKTAVITNLETRLSDVLAEINILTGKSFKVTDSDELIFADLAKTKDGLSLIAEWVTVLQSVISLTQSTIGIPPDGSTIQSQIVVK